MKEPEFISKYFAIVVDGEVAWIQFVDVQMKGFVAALQSDPIVVEIPDELLPDILPTNGTNWIVVDGKFVAPE